MKRLDVRARVLREARAFFDARGFLEVQTPVRVPSPGMDLHLDAFPAGDAWLATSPEYQMKRLLGDGWHRIYQIGPAFRRGEEGSRHNPEFTMLEWYRGGASVDDVLRDTEQLVARVSGGAFVLGQGGEERVVTARPPFERIPVGEAFERFAGVPSREAIAMAEGDEDRYFRLLVERVEPALERLDRAVFLVDYPASQASLARKKPGDDTVAERFELYVAGVELCNGFGELVDPVEQRARFVADREARARRGLPVYPIDEKLLDSLARVPPSGGNALGLDRLAALAAGTTDIAAVIAFTASEL